MTPGAGFSYYFGVGVDVGNATLNPQTGVVVLQTGDSVKQSVDSHHVEMWGPAGVACVPANPTQGQPSCQALLLKRSDYDIAFGFRDTRATAIYGNLAPGETCLYATTGQARLVCKADGSVNAITTDANTSSGNSVFWRVNPSEERFFAPFGQRWQDATGFHIRTSSGARLDIGGIGLPAPFSSFGSYANLTAEIVRLDGAVVTIGRENGFNQAVVQAQALQTLLVALQTALTDIQASIDGIAAVFTSFTGTGTFPGLTAFASLTTATNTAVTAANAALGIIATPAATGGTATMSTVS